MILMLKKIFKLEIFALRKKDAVKASFFMSKIC